MGLIDGPGLLYGPTHTYSNTPRSLNYRRNGVQDWTRKKVHLGTNPPAVVTLATRTDRLENNGDVSSRNLNTSANASIGDLCI